MGQKDIELIVNNSMNARQLIFFNCTIGKLDKTLKFDKTQDYGIERISLWLTADEHHDDKLTHEKLEIFVGALGETTIKATLKDVRVDASANSLLEVKKVFVKHGFDVQVTDEPIIVPE